MVPSDLEARAEVEKSSVDDQDTKMGSRRGGASRLGTPNSPKEENKTEVEDDTQYPAKKVVASITAGLVLSAFLVALDRTILATAIPRITDEFKSLDDIGWYGSAYMLTGCAFQLPFGKLYTLYNIKWVYLVSIVIFLGGSALCGGAPNSTAFIIGRALAGCGSAGISQGQQNVIMAILPLHKRPGFMAAFFSIFGIAAIAGPLIGGGLTTNVSWRWCFYINLPTGAVTAIVVVLLVNPPPKKDTASKKPLRVKVMLMDPLGMLLLLPGIICLLLALQWGGIQYSWANARIIMLFVLAGLLLVAFCVSQTLRKQTAVVTVPPRIIKQRSIAGGFWYMFSATAAMMIMIYYLPLWFQAVKGVSAVKSGEMSLPLLISMILGSAMVGAAVQRIGYYTPFVLLSSVLVSIATGLCTTLKVNSGHAYWIGYQVFLGIGIGSGMMQTGMAAQTVLSKQDAPMGMALMFFAQGLAGAIFLSVGQTVFVNALAKDLGRIVNLNPQVVGGSGATEIRHLVPASLVPTVLEAYNGAITKTFHIPVVMAALSILGGLAMEWKSVKKNKKKENSGKAEKGN